MNAWILYTAGLCQQTAEGVSSDPVEPSQLSDFIQSGTSGFLGTRGTLMIDVVVLAMALVIPILAWSIQLAKKGRYELHRRVQLVLASVLLVAIVAFEVDLRFLSDWRSRAAISPYYSADSWSAVWTSLTIHLCFAIPTFVLWIAVVWLALSGFPKPASPSPHSGLHKRLGKLAGIGMFLTAVTGWIFYYLAFAASPS